VRTSLFRRITRYPVALSNPRENRLTEVTAAVLNEVDGLALPFVRQLLSASREDVERRGLGRSEATRRARLTAALDGLAVPRVEVNTQVATKQGRFVDLELLLRPAVGSGVGGLLVWVEVKHGADLTDDQLQAYLEDIRMRPVPEHVGRFIVLLAPRGWTPGAGIVSTGVLMVDWQGVGRAMKEANAVARPPAQRWLLSEYIRYLKEEALTDPDALTAASALALMDFNVAAASAAGICEHADDFAQMGWGAPADCQKTRHNRPVPAFGTSYWATYDAHRTGDEPSPNWRGAWFEWGMRQTASMDRIDAPRGSWAFVAGVTLTKDNPTRVPDNAEWYGRLIAGGFKYFWLDPYYRLARVRYPDALLAATTLEEQGRSLGQWVAETFAQLAEEPPPA